MNYFIKSTLVKVIILLLTFPIKGQDTFGQEPGEGISCDHCTFPNGIYQNDVYQVDQIIPQQGIKYTNAEVPAKYMDIYLAPNSCPNRPIVILLPGSGFIDNGIDDPKFSPQSIYTATYFAQKGYVVAVVDYQRLLNPYLSVNLFNGVVHTAAKDITAAIQYLVGIQSILNIDVNSMFIIGQSAGGIAGLSALFSDDGGNLLDQEIPSSFVYSNALNSNSVFPNANNYTIKAFSGISTAVPTENIFYNRVRNVDLDMIFVHSVDDQVVPYNLGSSLPVSSPPTVMEIIRSKFCGSECMVNNIISSNSNNCYKLNGVNSSSHDIFGVYPGYQYAYHTFMRDFFYEKLICIPNCISYSTIYNAPDGYSRIKQIESKGSIEATDVNSIIMYPNPMVDHLTISGLQEDLSSNIEVSSLDGKVILSKTVVQSKIILDVSSFPRGLYVVHVKTINGNFTQKVIKK